MTEFEVIWYSQSVAMVAVVVGMLAILVRAARWSYRRHGHGREHGVIVAGAALVVGIGNVMTTYGRAADISDLRDIGGIMVRGALVLGVIYMLAWGPGRPHD